MGHRCCVAAAMFRPDLPGRGWVLDPASPRREASLFNSAGNPWVFRPFFYLHIPQPSHRLKFRHRSDHASPSHCAFHDGGCAGYDAALNIGAAGHGDQRHQQHRHLYGPGPALTGGGARSPFCRPRTGPAAATAGTRPAPAGEKPVAGPACAAGTGAAGAISWVHHRHFGLTPYRLARWMPTDRSHGGFDQTRSVGTSERHAVHC